MKNTIEIINKLFNNVLETIDLILTNDFYHQKGELLQVKEKVNNWFQDFSNTETLLTITPTDLEFIDLEITDLFDNYIQTESVERNYSERLSYYFGILKKEWKEEMCRGNYTFVYEPIPTEKNIEYIFQRLIFAVIEASNYEPYKTTRPEWEKILEIITKWLSIYINDKNLLEINWDEFLEIKEQLFQFDSKYLSADGLYAEEAYEWILQLEIILEKLKNKI